MHELVMTSNIDSIARQRNLFIALLILAVFACSCLSFILLTRSDKTVLVPGLTREVWTSDAGVSKSYLEETTAMFLPLLLDLNADSIDWKKEYLFAHVSQSDPLYMQCLNEYFAATKEKYRKFTLSTHFAVKSFIVDQHNMTVEAHGSLSSRFGERGYTSVPAIYRLKFEWVAGKLLLTEFFKLSNDDEEVSHEKD